MLAKILLVALVALPVASFAQSSMEFARMGQATWSAFRCSTLAALSSDQKEQDRHFKIGYDNGKRFFAAFDAKKIHPADMESEVPIAIITLMGGPTADFMLGRIFEAAMDSAAKDVLNADRSLQKTLAQSKFASQSCGLLK
ncbi:hypothetical protein [Variovorax sp. PvP013]|uniref:hypothetical protein n=1 Tax=Variovorax sp. PvP013 TaxID=3156435 RepID=UPI003D1E957C